MVTTSGLCFRNGNNCFFLKNFSKGCNEFDHTTFFFADILLNKFAFDIATHKS